ncbi:MAG: gamma-glutamylcyclotransferase [Vulcanococcus sp.]
MPIALFVYGTLMRGHSNHHWLAGARFGGERRLAGVRLHNLGPFPMAVPAADNGPQPGASSVWGELWWIDAACLAHLDRLEGHPRLYERRQLPLEGGPLAWVYLGRPRQVRHSPVLAEGRWGGSAAGRG